MKPLLQFALLCLRSLSSRKRELLNTPGSCRVGTLSPSKEIERFAWRTAMPTKWLFCRVKHPGITDLSTSLELQLQANSRVEIK